VFSASFCLFSFGWMKLLDKKIQMGVFIQVGAVKSAIACKEFHPFQECLLLLL
jgi:hypothetical protein